MKYCDLHTHSNHSDGTCSPTRVVELAVEAGLSAVALCDHNTTSGLKEFMQAGADMGIETIAGVEFSVDYKGKELHMLGLFLTPEQYGAVGERAEQYLKDKTGSDIRLCQSLTAAGLPLDYEQIKARTADGFVNRAVIGAEMVRKGYVPSVQEAFSQYLSPKYGHYRPPVRPDSFEIIRFIKSVGAVAVLAHPFLSLEQEELEMFLPAAAAAGLDGMEVCYSKYDEKTTELSKKLAEKYSLLPSGGSDFHGENKPDIAVGKGRGDLQIPLGWKNQLKHNIL